MQFEEAKKQEEFMRLYEPVRDRLWRYIRSLVWRQDDARDVESDTIMQAYINLHKLRDESSFQYFLFGIASRLLKQKERKRRLQTAFLIRRQRSSGFSDPVHSLDLEILYEAIKKLPPKERETIVLYEISGLSINEIHELHGASIVAIKTRLSRARSRLNGFFSHDGKKYTLDNNSEAMHGFQFSQPVLKQKYE